MTLEELLEAAVLTDGPEPVSTSTVNPGGVDPLGLRQINFQLMDMVLPDLNNVARRLRPFIVLAWAWRRVRQLVEREGKGGETDERMRDFVDRVEAIYAWSQFLIDSDPGIPGGQALLPLIASESYLFGGKEWQARRDLRRSSTGLISPLNYGPGARLMGWLEPTDVRGVFRPNPSLDGALDAFEAPIKDELQHPAFNQIGEVAVEREHVRRWGQLWSLDDLSDEERAASIDRLSGLDASVARREGLALVEQAVQSLADARSNTASVRRRMAQPAPEWSGSASVAQAAAKWRKVQVRQAFRLALEGLLHWIIGELIDVPLDSRTLARRFLSEAGFLPGSDDATSWLQSLQSGVHPVDHIEAMEDALAGRGDRTVARAISQAIAFCLTEVPDQPEDFERFDRLPLVRAGREAGQWGKLSPEEFIIRVIEVWVLAQHAYWCVGRGLADARSRGKTLLRLKVVMDEGGWTVTPGTGQGDPPVPTPDRLESALGLLRESGRI